ncbi:hypothetical protein ABZ783_01690 [Micromonospora sp. NPDC047738]|uniref:hypothetical protein n=1 Tax=Micromonospora sp. NPDC047738 TaxID=3155741 RepID=UPI0033CECDB6
MGGSGRIVIRSDEPAGVVGEGDLVGGGNSRFISGTDAARVAAPAGRGRTATGTTSSRSPRAAVARRSGFGTPDTLPSRSVSPRPAGAVPVDDW